MQLNCGKIVNYFRDWDVVIWIRREMFVKADLIWCDLIMCLVLNEFSVLPDERYRYMPKYSYFPVGKIAKKQFERVRFMLFRTQNIVPYCQNTLLQTDFSAILPTGIIPNTVEIPLDCLFHYKC